MHWAPAAGFPVTSTDEHATHYNHHLSTRRPMFDCSARAATSRW
jgi:hypothetical protein